MRNPVSKFVRVRWHRQAATAAVAIFTIGFVVLGSDGVPSPESLLLSPLLASSAHAASTNGGYWVASADGGVFTFGTAKFYGSLAGRKVAAPITNIVATPDGKGYWLVAKDGGVFSFGDAVFAGSLAGKLAAPAVGIATSAGTAAATTGATGATGARGATGAPGPVGPSNFAYVYNHVAQTVAVEASVTFDSNGPISGFTHTLGASAITVSATGNYRVDLSVSATEVNQFALMVNGVAAAGGIYGSGAGTQQDTGHAILSLTAGDVLTLRNHTSPAAVTLPTVIGGTQANVNASLLIEQVG